MPPTQPELRHAALDRRGAANINLIWDSLVDLHGRPAPGVRALNADADNHPRLSEFTFVNERAGWHNLADGASGTGVIDLIQHLGQCSRTIAVEFLQSLVDRLPQPEGN